MFKVVFTWVDQEQSPVSQGWAVQSGLLSCCPAAPDRPAHQCESQRRAQVWNMTRSPPFPKGIAPSSTDQMTTKKTKADPRTKGRTHTPDRGPELEKAESRPTDTHLRASSHPGRRKSSGKTAGAAKDGPPRGRAGPAGSLRSSARRRRRHKVTGESVISVASRTGGGLWIN